MYMVHNPSKYDDVICEQPLTYILIIIACWSILDSYSYCKYIQHIHSGLWNSIDQQCRNNNFLDCSTVLQCSTDLQDSTGQQHRCSNIQHLAFRVEYRL